MEGMLRLSPSMVPVRFVAGGLPKPIRLELMRCHKAIFAEYAKGRNYTGVRPWHEGKMYEVGWNNRNNQWSGPNGCSQRVAELTKRLLTHVLQSPVMQLYKESAKRMNKDAEAELPSPQTLCKEGDTKAFLGDCYSPVPPGSTHARPWQVSMSTTRHCTNGEHEPSSCEDCVSGTCTTNPFHLDTYDRGVTVLVLWQSKGVPASLESMFLVGTKAYSFRSGAILVFDGRHTHHGHWRPNENISARRRKWFGLAFVKQ